MKESDAKNVQPFRAQKPKVIHFYFGQSGIANQAKQNTIGMARLNECYLESECIEHLNQHAQTCDLVELEKDIARLENCPCCKKQIDDQVFGPDQSSKKPLLAYLVNNLGTIKNPSPEQKEVIQSLLKKVIALGADQKKSIYFLDSVGRKNCYAINVLGLYPEPVE